MTHKKTCWLVLLYGIAMVLLGLTGYLQGNSRMSLMAGGGFGALLLCSARLMFSQHRSGLYAATFLTLALTATFSVRYALKHNPLMGALSILSCGMLLFLMTQMAQWRKVS